MRKRLLLIFALISTLLAGCGASTQEDFERRVGQAMRAPDSDPTATSPMSSLRRVAMSAANTNDGTSITPDQLFDWAEATYPQFFPSREKTLTWSNYQFRYYKDTDVYLAVENGAKVVALGKPTANKIVVLGVVEDFYGQVSNYLKATASVVKRSIVLKDPAYIYAAACKSATMSMIIPVKLNNDSLVDFFVHYWCPISERLINPQPVGTPETIPTIDFLVAWVSDDNGEYRVANEEIFGRQLVSLGGASDKYVRTDLNQDGRDDFAFAMNFEDGRFGAETASSTSKARPAVLMSMPDNKYSNQQIGLPDALYSVTAVINDDKSTDLLFGGFSNQKLQAHRYSNGSFIDVTEIYPRMYGGNWAPGLLAINQRSITKYLITPTYNAVYPDGKYTIAEIGLTFFEKSNGSWQLLNYLLHKVSFSVQMITWNLAEFPVTVFKVDNKQYLGGTYDHMCQIERLKSSGSPVIVARWSSAEHQTQRTLKPGDQILERELRATSTLRFFTFDSNGISSIPSPIVNEEIEGDYRQIVCTDLNNDGFVDIATFPFTRPSFNVRSREKGRPSVYLNDGTGALIKKDIGTWPGFTNEYAESKSLMHDLDGDGVYDLILHAWSTSQGGDIQIHLMRRY